MRYPVAQDITSLENQIDGRQKRVEEQRGQAEEEQKRQVEEDEVKGRRRADATGRRKAETTGRRAEARGRGGETERSKDIR